MSRAAGRVLALVVAVAAVVGLIAMFQSRDESTLDEPASAQAPGERRTSKLEPALERELRRGNVVILHRGPKAPEEYADDDPSLRDAGQAVIARRDPDLGSPFVAHSAERQQEAASEAGLREFVDYWLGGR